MRLAAAALTAMLISGTAAATTGAAAMAVPEMQPAPQADESSTSATLIVEVDDQVDPAQLGAILDVVAGNNIEVVHSNSRFGLLTLEATQAGEALVEQLSVVDSVTESRQLHLFLEESVAVVEGDLIRAAGATGTGKAVVVIDSGIDTSHPGIAPLVREACFLAGTLAVCPNGQKSAFGAGMGVPCSGDAESCTHGTHVAGIVSASSLTIGAETDVDGVAPDVGIISIRVMDDSHTTDTAVLAALAHVLNLHDEGLDIASVNLSLGGDADGCVPGLWASPIAQLNAAGIAIVAASGNTAGEPVAFPACLDGVIAVGATLRAEETMGSGSDGPTFAYNCSVSTVAAVTGFTQHGPELDIVAPGACIDSTVTTDYDPDGISSWNGTSMAAPHVAALLALLDGNQSGWSAERSMELLRSTGDMITLVTPSPSDRDPRYPEPRALAALEFEPFTDADYGFWVIAADWAKATGVSTGTGGTEFDHARTLSRAEAVTFLWRLMGSPAPTIPNPFADVPAGTWYSEAVVWAAEEGITTGTTVTTFEPDAGVTRGQIATFFWRLVGEPDHGTNSGFSDVPLGQFYTSPVTWMALFELTTGTTPTTFSPDEVVTRAQMITFLWRLVNAGEAWGSGVVVPDGAMF